MAALSDPRGSMGRDEKFVNRRQRPQGGSGRIDRAGRSPGAAAQDPPGRQPAPLPGAVLADRPFAVVAAGGREAAADPEVAHVRRERRLVEMDGAKEGAGGELIA